jgi:hypothetical protein
VRLRRRILSVFADSPNAPDARGNGTGRTILLQW